MQTTDYRPISFSEQVILNGTLLDWICPITCEKIHVSGIGFYNWSDSFPKKFNKLKRTYLKTALKHLAPLLRISVIGIVSITISPIGMCYNGALSLFYLGKYSIKKYATKQVESSKSWDKTIAYGKAFFSDLSCAAIGISCFSSILIGSYAAFWMTHSIVYGAGILNTQTVIANLSLLSLVIVVAAKALGAFSPSEQIARILGNSENISRLYYSLEFRNVFGFVSSDNEILRFSKSDELQYSTYSYFAETTNFSFKGNACDFFGDYICAFEERLIKNIAKTNKFLKSIDKSEIPFSYPFKSQDVTKTLENATTTDMERKKILIRKIKEISAIGLISSNR
jgi:hypothetical protein